ncbi:D-galactarolactone cycloisomerase [Marinobacterium zhoushanense]|uniref:D-galactarolactone cycloisomerase n=2 Tax=Marinobacterium zhoushanense TaxID=1679163 RepID=A0ABQ1JXQ0_9GAMM|nr:D-galactarolactone cycloisomerase [Marinobacterium zhoushanense]
MTQMTPPLANDAQQLPTPQGKSQMCIKAITTHLLEQPLDRPFESSATRFSVRRHLLVEIECDGGLTGWGECLGHVEINAAIVKAMTPLLIGRSALDIEPIWLELYNQFRDQGQRGATVNAISGIDIALWDLCGKYYNAPIHQLMGGAFRDRVPAYATGGFRQVGLDRISSLRHEVQGFVDAGFRAVKIKIGFGIALDIESIAAVREVIGPDIRLMIDANHGYDAVAAAQIIRLAAPYDIDWFEEPVVPEALSSYRRLRELNSIPIAGGETWHTRWGIAEALRQEAVDILQPDVGGVGGLSEARRLLTLCDIHGVRCVPHIWGTDIALAAGLHFHAIIPPSPPAFEAESAWLEFDQSDNPMRAALLKHPIQMVDGMVRIPSGPGLGIEINKDALAPFYPKS